MILQEKLVRKFKEFVRLHGGNKMKGKYDYNKLKEIDWDFKGVDTLYLTHSFHSYPARFIPQIPRTIIENFTIENETILDPFCGCGTTLVEAVFLKRMAIGVDINPIAALITKVKTKPINPEILEYYAKNLMKSITSIILQLRGQKTFFMVPIPKIKIPPMPRRKLSKKFTSQIKKELACIKAKIMEIENEDIKDFFLLALSSTIRTIVESKSKNLDVLSIFKQDIKTMIKRMKEFYKICPNPPPVSIFCADFREAWYIQDNSVDAIVTSPTYVNAYDYHREHMFNIFWLHDYLYNKFGVDFDTFRKNELGAHSHFIYNRFLAVAEYFEGMYRCLQHICRVLKEGRVCCIVIGDSTVEGEYINTHKFFKEMGNEIGLEVKLDILRNINVERKYLSKTIGKINQEHVLIFEKTKNNWENGDSIEYTRKLIKRLLKKCKEKNKTKIIETLNSLSRLFNR